MTNDLRELSVTRFIAAPPETVFRVWTTRLGEWFTPKPWTTPEWEVELKPGGRFRTLMQGPEGERMDNTGVFLDVEPGRKLVFTDAFGPGWAPQNPFMLAIITFEPEGEGTRYTARARHWSEEALKQHEGMGFLDGWGAVAAQLAALAEAEAAKEAA